ncbi:MAG: hypothetical protein D6748_14390, partial [Calditrichaeota bacterium]
VVQAAFGVVFLKSWKISSRLQTGMFAYFVGMPGKLVINLRVHPGAHDVAKGGVVVVGRYGDLYLVVLALFVIILTKSLHIFV